MYINLIYFVSSLLRSLLKKREEGRKKGKEGVGGRRGALRKTVYLQNIRTGNNHNIVPCLP